jgi:hypothetical protein
LRDLRLDIHRNSWWFGAAADPPRGYRTERRRAAIALAALPGSSVLSRVCRIHLGAAPKKILTSAPGGLHSSSALHRRSNPVANRARQSHPPRIGVAARLEWAHLPTPRAFAPTTKFPMLPVPPPSRDPKQLIAIVGMAGRFPGAADVDGLWRLLVTRGDAIRPVPTARWGRERPRHPRQRAGGGGRRPGPPRPSDRCAGGRACRYQRTTPNMPNGTRSIRDPA